ncbi:MAG: proton-conducting transporter membrane subunit, partial [Calditrichia bacterium]
MVDPIYILAIALGVAFLLPVIKKGGTVLFNTVFFMTLASVAAISAAWLYGFLSKDLQTVQIFTAGVKPPLSINLQLGISEAFFITAANILMLVGSIYLFRLLRSTGVRAYVLYLLLAVGLNGLIMTRDIFNVFVFLEITSIASYALVGIELKGKALTSGFRYMVAGNLASIFLLLGIIFLYSISGTLNIDGMIGSAALKQGGLLTQLAVFMLLFALFIEMKQFPANGWALDVYQSVHPGVAALISAGSSGAIYF